MNNPNNPLSNLTDKDLLLYNPNYTNFLEKLKKKNAEKSALGAILNEKNMTMNKKKKPTALYAFKRIDDAEKLR